MKRKKSPLSPSRSAPSIPPMIEITIPPRSVQDSPYRLLLRPLQASCPLSPVPTIDNLTDIPTVFPSRPSSRSSSVAEEPSQNLLHLCQCLHQMSDRVSFSPDQISIPDNSELNDLSDGKSILIPVLCPLLNALTSMTKQVDTITTQLATVQSKVATFPTYLAMESALSWINATLHDLSHRVSAVPPGPSAPHQVPIPPAGVVEHLRQHPQPPNLMPPPQRPATATCALTLISPAMIQSGAFSMETSLMLIGFPTSGNPTGSATANTQTSRRSSWVILTSTTPNFNRPSLRLPQLSSPRWVIRRRTHSPPHMSGPSATRCQRFRFPSRSYWRKAGSTLLALPPQNTTKPP